MLIFKTPFDGVISQLNYKNNELVPPNTAVNKGELIAIGGNERKKIRVQTGKVNDRYIEVVNDSIKPTDLIVTPKSERKAK